MDRSSTRVLTALLVAVVSIPLSTQALERKGPDAETISAVQTEALHYRTAKWPLIRRAYSRAVEEYRRKLREGQEAEMPDISDLSTFKRYLEELGVDADEETRRRVEPNAPREPKVKGLLNFSADDTEAGTDLQPNDRVILRQYMRAGFCPPSLKEMYEGIYETCLALIGNRQSAVPRGLGSDLQEARARLRKPATLKLRLLQLEQGKDRSNRREDGSGPPRPTPYRGEAQ